jgi:hypothetical protein
MKRTTIFADEATLEALRRFAREDGGSIADLIRQALARFVAERDTPRKLPSLVGIGRSGRKDIADRHEELLWRKARRRRHG